MGIFSQLLQSDPQRGSQPLTPLEPTGSQSGSRTEEPGGVSRFDEFSEDVRGRESGHDGPTRFLKSTLKNGQKLIMVIGTNWGWSWSDPLAIYRLKGTRGADPDHRFGQILTCLAFSCRRVSFWSMWAVCPRSANELTP